MDYCQGAIAVAEGTFDHNWIECVSHSALPSSTVANASFASKDIIGRTNATMWNRQHV
jgi:hypothetical protein